MNVQTTTEKRLLCPSCRKKGRRVSPITLRALLKPEYVEGIAASELEHCESNRNGETGCKPATGDTGWRFCHSQDCDVVYFAEEHSTTFTKSQLNVSVGVKEKTGDRPLCYCFGHSVTSIKQELRAKGRSNSLEDIRQEMNDPGCKCEVTNPSGSCCLGSVAKGIEIAKLELGHAGSDEPPTRPPRSRRNWGEGFAKIGTLVSAVVASSCCWLPLVLLAVGVSGAGIAATLEAYRPIFIVVTFGFLGAAFYFTYRPRQAAKPIDRSPADAADACCAAEPSESPEACCAPSGRRWFSMMAVNMIMLWVVTVLAVAFLLFPHYVGLLLGTGDGKTITANMTRAVVKIEGMTCEGCATTVAKAVRSVPGVLAVQVDYQKGEAVIGTEACCPVPREEIVAALENAGYSGAFLEPEE